MPLARSITMQCPPKVGPASIGGSGKMNAFYLLDDFHSSGRISGNQRIPLAKLVSGKKYIVEGQRLEVNPSVDRYKREMANLSAAL